MVTEVQPSSLPPTIRMPLVSVIILNYNDMQHLRDCLNSVKRLAYPNLETILVDNASTDGSVEYVKNNYPWVRVVQNERNLGFAAGNNVGIASAKGEYFFLLNVDTEADVKCLDYLVNAANSDKTVGICGCKLLLFYERNIFQSAGGRYNLAGIPWDRGTYEVDAGQYDKLDEPSFVCGAAMLMKKKVASKIGAFDPVFFMYNEDVELCLKSWSSGFRVLYVPNAIVYHKWRLDISRRQKPDFAFHMHKNTLLILLKNFKAITVIRWMPLALAYKLLWTGNYLNAGNPAAALAVLRSMTWTLRNFPHVLRERRKFMPRRLKSDSVLKKCGTPLSEALKEYRRRALLGWGTKVQE